MALWFRASLLGFVWLCMLAMAWATDEGVKIPSLVELPKGSIISVTLLDNVSTETDHVGQAVVAAVAQDVFIGTRKILSRADRAIGHVTRIDPPIRGRNAILRIDFDTLAMADGQRLSIDALTDTGKDDHTWGGETTLGTQAKVVPYKVWRIGTYGRAMLTGPRAMGQPVKFLPGSRWVIVINQPISLIGY